MSMSADGARNRKVEVALILVALVTLALAFGFMAIGKAEAEETAADPNAECLQCHGMEGFSSEVDGKTVALYVDPEKFASSTHGVLTCTTCHTDISGYPHENPVFGAALADKVQKECATCHEDAVRGYEYSFHGTARLLGYTASPGCTDCHGNAHNILPQSDPNSLTAKQNVPKTCARCHGEVLPNFAKGSTHATPQDKDTAFPLWIVWKLFLALILFDILKDGGIILLELTHRWRSLRHHKPAGKKADTAARPPVSASGAERG